MFEACQFHSPIYSTYYIPGMVDTISTTGGTFSVGQERLHNPIREGEEKAVEVSTLLLRQHLLIGAVPYC